MQGATQNQSYYTSVYALMIISLFDMQLCIRTHDYIFFSYTGHDVYLLINDITLSYTAYILTYDDQLYHTQTPVYTGHCRTSCNADTSRNSTE